MDPRFYNEVQMTAKVDSEALSATGGRYAPGFEPLPGPGRNSGARAASSATVCVTYRQAVGASPCAKSTRRT
jgi:hypothetical protein